jgi:hypothetical protein
MFAQKVVADAKTHVLIIPVMAAARFPSQISAVIGANLKQ